MNDESRKAKLLFVCSGSLSVVREAQVEINENVSKIKK
jgi:hypothetical protein